MDYKSQNIEEIVKKVLADMIGDAAAAQRALIKAGEEGGKAYENACQKLHREWAERLRRKEPLPALSLRYFSI